MMDSTFGGDGGDGGGGDGDGGDSDGGGRPWWLWWR